MAVAYTPLRLRACMRGVNDQYKKIIDSSLFVFINCNNVGQFCLFVEIVGVFLVPLIEYR